MPCLKEKSRNRDKKFLFFGFGARLHTQRPPQYQKKMA